MQPPPRQRGGPPIWCGGRSDAALARAARLADGWISYVVTPAMFAESLAKIARFAAAAERRPEELRHRTLAVPASRRRSRRGVSRGE